MKLTNEEFVLAWQNAKTRQEVADACDASTASVSMRATKLRNKGVHLRLFDRGRPKGSSSEDSINIDELNALIAANKKKE